MQTHYPILHFTGEGILLQSEVYVVEVRYNNNNEDLLSALSPERWAKNWKSALQWLRINMMGKNR